MNKKGRKKKQLESSQFNKESFFFYLVRHELKINEKVMLTVSRGGFFFCTLYVGERIREWGESERSSLHL